jgi:hypothetical protein
MKFLILFLFLIPSGAFAQGITYKSDCCDFSFTLDSQWVRIPDDVFKERIKLLTGDYSKLKFEAGFSLHDRQYFTLPYILIQDLSPLNQPVDSIVNHFARTYTIVEESDPGVYDRLLIADRSEMVYLIKEEILFLIMDINQPGAGLLKGFTAMMLGGSIRFQINYYSTVEDFEMNLEEFMQIINTVKFE